MERNESLAVDQAFVVEAQERQGCGLQLVDADDDAPGERAEHVEEADHMELEQMLGRLVCLWQYDE